MTGAGHLDIGGAHRAGDHPDDRPPRGATGLWHVNDHHISRPSEHGRPQDIISSVGVSSNQSNKKGSIYIIYWGVKIVGCIIQLLLDIGCFRPYPRPPYRSGGPYSYPADGAPALFRASPTSLLIWPQQGTSIWTRVMSLILFSLRMAASLSMYSSLSSSLGHPMMVVLPLMKSGCMEAKAKAVQSPASSRRASLKYGALGETNLICMGQFPSSEPSPIGVPTAARGLSITEWRRDIRKTRLFHLLDMSLGRLLVERFGLSLFNGQRPLWAFAQACAEPIAQQVLDDLGLALPISKAPSAQASTHRPQPLHLSSSILMIFLIAIPSRHVRMLFPIIRISLSHHRALGGSTFVDLSPGKRKLPSGTRPRSKRRCLHRPPRESPSR